MQAVASSHTLSESLSMFKTVANEVWAFDAEWVPDPKTGRLLYGLPQDTPDRDVIETMWRQGGATEKDPQPYLKTLLCRLVSIAYVIRKVRGDGQVSLSLLSLPKNAESESDRDEAHMLTRFLEGIGRNKPQLVGYNSQGADIKILIQRSIVNGISAPGFCQRPEKPWEGVDYFARGSEAHVDLQEVVSSWGKTTPSLHELAMLCGIPGKMEVNGQEVAEMWLAGDLKGIVAYNELDALTTYLVWLRMAHFGGFFSPEAYAEEQERVRALIANRARRPGAEHLLTYQAEWDRLQAYQLAL